MTAKTKSATATRKPAKRSTTANRKTKAPAARTTAKTETKGQPARFDVLASDHFDAWLAEHNISLALTTYQTGKLFFFGLNPEDRLSVFNRTLERCMGMTYCDNALYVATLNQLLKFVDAAAGSPIQGAYDSLFVPQSCHYTGNLDIHDIAVDTGGRLLFANTMFNCVAHSSDTHSFHPVWKPHFIDTLQAEDRCHLNGIALDDGKLRFATSVSQSNVSDGWREQRGAGGIVLDTDSNEIVASGLSMPHSPRVYRDKLWLHNSGTGHFGYVDEKAGRFEPVTFCPGYLRGLDFAGDYAIAGLSKPRDNNTFSGLELDANLAGGKSEAKCGLDVIDLKTGKVEHSVSFEGIVSELYDVTVLPGRKNASAIGFRSDEINRVISVGGWS